MGAVGAAAPEVVRLYKQVTRTPPGTPQFTWSYIIVSVLFMALGGFVAVAAPIGNEGVGWKCFALGVSLPTVISALPVLASAAIQTYNQMNKGDHS